MLLSEKVILRWNPKIKKHYVDLGYQYTKMGDEFEVGVKDLTHYSNVKVKVECDYCHNTYYVQWGAYLKLKQKQLQKDCCGNPECTGKKSAEALLLKYGTSNIREIPGVNEKIAKTNLEKYGSENPFGSKDIIEKIKNTNLEKYGYEWYTQTDEYKERAKQTCMEKYGVPNYSYTDEFIEFISGENSPCWKGDNVKIPRERYRDCADYRNWRKSVFDRDHYTCMCCGARNGNGKYVRLNAHHIENFATNIEGRYDVDNGVTLCTDCHIAFHSCYGKKNNTKEQLDEFILLNKKISDEEIC